jgi:carbonic anhydrase
MRPVRFGLAAAVALGLAAVTAAAQAQQVQTKESQAAMTPAAALEQLKTGNERFAAGQSRPRNLKLQITATAAGQYPFAAILSCMDSRVPAEIVFDQGIGDLFSIRVAGNVVDDDNLGSLEYAVGVAGAKFILVLGHTSCGAVKGAIDGVKLGNLTGLLEKIGPAIAASGPRHTSKDEAYVTRVARENVLLATKEIRKRSPVIARLVEEGKVGLEGGLYDVATGHVVFFAD